MDKTLEAGFDAFVAIDISSLELVTSDCLESALVDWIHV